ncbi:hypothetical protein P7C70_g5672, partial [Phenoliferia sp. Uapishka_3]
MSSSSTHSRTISDHFDSFDAMLQEEVGRNSALSDENAALRGLLTKRDSDDSMNQQRSATPDAANLQSQLAAARIAQEEMAKELQALKSSRATDGEPSEVDLLRQSLATLASELESQKSRAAEQEKKRIEEEEKVAMLRTKVEESRRALMRVQGEAASRRTSVSVGQDAVLSALGSRRGSGVFDASTRRRSSLGLPAPGGLGLGFGSESAVAGSSPTRSNLSRTASANLAHRRGSASLSYSYETPGEEDRMARMRDLRLGLTTTKCSSRRNSAITGNDFNGDLDYYEPEKRRIPSFSFPSSRSIDEDDTDPLSRPPSAPLRLQGRKQSVAVFENWDDRRSSVDSVQGIDAFRLGAPFNRRASSYGDTREPSTSDMAYQIESLRLQLAESEESRIASEHCLKALKEFISTPPQEGERHMSLPPLPTDPDSDSSSNASGTKRRSSSRWTIPRIPGLGRRESASSSTLTLPDNSTSTTSTLHGYTPRSAHNDSFPAASNALFGSVPTFGAFSFSNLVNRQSGAPVSDGDESPTGGESVSQFANTPHDADDERSPHLEEQSDSEISIAPSLTDSSASSGESSRSNSPTSSSASSVALSPDLVRICDATFEVDGCLAPALNIDAKALGRTIPSPRQTGSPALAFGLMP